MNVAINHVALAPKSSVVVARFYRPELDVLRFVAFLSVFTVHAFLVSPGTIPGQRILAPIGAYGLCLFFFLSSYLITELLTRESESTGTVHVKAFYLRRILRIWPLYFGFLLCAKVFGHFYPFFALENLRFLAFSLLSGNFYLTKFGSSWSPADPLWSISLEEQFYLVWPLIAAFGGRRGLALIAAVLLPIGCVSLYWHSGYKPAQMGLEFDGTIWCNSLIQFQFFALGALLAILMRGRALRCSAPWRWAIFGSGFLVWLMASCLFRMSRFQDQLPGGVLLFGYGLIAAGCILLFLGLLGTTARLPRVIVYLGQISYGLYVFHWFFLECVFVMPHIRAGLYAPPRISIGVFAGQYLLAFMATVLAALLCYRYFETPFLKLKKRFTWVPSRTL